MVKLCCFFRYDCPRPGPIVCYRVHIKSSLEEETEKDAKIDLKLWKHTKIIDMNKEIYYEGWLIKSPPTKRIWRAVSNINWIKRWTDRHRQPTAVVFFIIIIIFINIFRILDVIWFWVYNTHPPHYCIVTALEKLSFYRKKFVDSSSHYMYILSLLDIKN